VISRCGAGCGGHEALNIRQVSILRRIHVGRILALDRGNHSLKIALFDSGAIIGRWTGKDGRPVEALRMIARELALESVSAAGARISAADRRRLLDALLNSVPFHSAVFASVGPHWTAHIRRALETMRVSRILEVSSRIVLPFEILIDAPARVGPDRLAAAAGVAAAGEREAIIVDAGTAITIDVLSKRGFLGGAILPGRDLMYRALHEGTAALPLVSDGDAAIEPPARNTRDAIIAGARWGTVGAVRELIARSRSRVSKHARVWVTGAGGDEVAGRLGGGARYEKDLVFFGLHRLFEMNCR
jgi:type III pantothenate kinase